MTWPLLLAGAGLGAMASQLGSVTVSSVPDEQSGEVGGLQNTGTQLGASIGTALAGAVLISALTASFFTGIQDNPDVPDSVVAQAETELAGGVPFISDDDLEAALADADVPAATADAIVETNEESRIDGLRAAVAILALLALVALLFTRGIPTVQPGAGTSRAQPDPMPEPGLEPGRPLGPRILSPPRLPVPPLRPRRGYLRRREERVGAALQHGLAPAAARARARA